MKLLGVTVIFIVFFLYQTNFSLGLKTVKYAAVVYRHGDRTPVKPYPKDPWKNQSFWPEKFGELTNIGKSQHYIFGRTLRKRYSHLISTKFDPSEVYIRSTDVDRTLMSAQANLAGMYPPNDGSIWNKHLMWQPIPVHTVPDIEDEILAMKKPCAVYEKEKLQYINSKSYKKRLSQYNELMEYLTEHTGSETNDYYDIEYIYNTLTIESLYNFTLPNWTQSVFPDKMREPACYSFRTSAATPLLARLKVGPLFKEIASRIFNTAEGHNLLKLSIYSAHDDTIGNILTAMGLFDGNCPVYTSAIFMELIHDDVNETHYVRILYRNNTGEEDPYILNIPNCGEQCPTAKFMELYQNLIVIDWEDECQIEVYKLILMIVLIALGMFYAIHFAFKVHYSKTPERPVLKRKLESYCFTIMSPDEILL